MRIATLTSTSFYRIADQITFKDNTTFLDYDILIWEPSNLLKEYYEVEQKNHAIINDDALNVILKDIHRRNQEIIHMLELGRFVFVYLPYPQKIKVYNLDEVNLLEYFTCFKMKTSPVRGTNIDFRGNEIFTSFWEETKENFKYEATFDEVIGKPFLYIKGTQIVLGSYKRVGKGHLVFIPPFIPKGKENTQENHKNKICFIDNISLLTKKLEMQDKPEEIEMPLWSKSYVLPGEHNQREDLLSLEKEIEDLTLKLNERKTAIKELERKKILFVGSGKPLEIEVEKIFKELGFTTVETLPNRDDLILQYNNKIFVVEIKGIAKKSAAEKHAAQLEKWVSEYHANKEVKPKGILVVNAYGDVPLKDRKEDAFPPQMVPFSKAREHCLITGLQLLGLYLDCKEDIEKKAKMIDLMFNTSGVFNEYQEWNKFVESENNDKDISYT